MKKWEDFLKEEEKKEYFKNLLHFVNEEYANKSINPSYENIFRAFKLTSLEDVKIVIIGQDPYPNKTDAVGLAFSVNENSKLPKSLINIYKELEDDLGIKRTNGDLTSWANNGVLLLNSILTVEEHKPLSHQNKGWEIFTNQVLQLLNNIDRKIVFILWGNYAKEKGKILNNPKHLVLTSSHPSPLGAYKGFFGSKPFSKACNFLEIDYKIWE